LHDAALYRQIACFLQNLFGKKLNSDSEKKQNIVLRINEISGSENTLSIEVEEKNWNKKTVPFNHQISSKDVLDFPEMPLRDLEIFFTGSYQLKQAVSYLAEMLQEDDTIKLSYVKKDKNILKFKLSLDT